MVSQVIISQCSVIVRMMSLFKTQICMTHGPGRWGRLSVQIRYEKTTRLATGARKCPAVL